MVYLKEGIQRDSAGLCLVPGTAAYDLHDGRKGRLITFVGDIMLESMKTFCRIGLEFKMFLTN